VAKSPVSHQHIQMKYVTIGHQSQTLAFVASVDSHLVVEKDCSMGYALAKVVKAGAIIALRLPATICEALADITVKRSFAIVVEELMAFNARLVGIEVVVMKIFQEHVGRTLRYIQNIMGFPKLKELSFVDLVSYLHYANQSLCDHVPLQLPQNTPSIYFPIVWCLPTPS